MAMIAMAAIRLIRSPTRLKISSCASGLGAEDRGPTIEDYQRGNKSAQTEESQSLVDERSLWSDAIVWVDHGFFDSFSLD